MLSPKQAAQPQSQAIPHHVVRTPHLHGARTTEAMKKKEKNIQKKKEKRKRKENGGKKRKKKGKKKKEKRPQRGLPPETGRKIEFFFESEVLREIVTKLRPKKNQIFEPPTKRKRIK